IELDSVPPNDPNTGTIQTFKREIIITIPNGVKYFFGGLNASESSFVNNSPTSGPELEPKAQTAFYLHKIEHPLGDEIYLDYTTYYYAIDIAKTARYTIIAWKDIDILETDISHSLAGLKTDQSILISSDGKALRRIRSNKNSYEVNFSSSSANDNVKMHYARILNNLKIKDTINPSETLKEVTFHYIYPYQGGVNENYAQRFFLEKINFYGSSSNKEYEYSMIYNEPESLPARFSYSQDYLGYYNGKHSNNTYLPKVDDPRFLNSGINYADRSFNFQFASKGTLKELHYPTKGHTLFEYETAMDSPTTSYDVLNNSGF